MELTFPWAPVKALANLASEADIRKWCMGVWIDTSAPTLRVMATNGAALGVYLTEEPSTNVPPVFLPLHIVKACKGFGPTATVRIDDTSHALIECMGTRHSWQDEKFVLVDYRRVFPKHCTGNAQQFDIAQAALFLKVHKALGEKASINAVRITHNSGAQGPEGAVVRLAGVPQFLGALAPLRETKDTGVLAPLDVPTWMFDRASATADAVCDLV